MAYYDGTRFKLDPHGRDCENFVARLLKFIPVIRKEIPNFGYAPEKAETKGNAPTEDLLQKIRIRLVDITAKRSNGVVSTTVGYNTGLHCADGTTIVINEDDIHIQSTDLDKEFFWSALDCSSEDIIPNLSSIQTLKEVIQHFPKFRESLEMCELPENVEDALSLDPTIRQMYAGVGDKTRLISTIVGIIVYYTQRNARPLDAWYYVYDSNKGGTGKTTHLQRNIQKFFKDYVANVDWDTFTGERTENADMLGKVAVFCDEAGTGEVKAIERMKSRSSGQWSLKVLYSNTVQMTNPLLLVNNANHPPVIAPQVAKSGALTDRLQICEFYTKLRDSGKNIPCSYDEYAKAVLNIGCWVAYQIFQHDGNTKKILPYYQPPEEVEGSVEFVDWLRYLSNTYIYSEGQKEKLTDVYDDVKKWYIENSRGGKLPPELRNQEEFAKTLHGRELEGVDLRQPYCKGKGRIYAKQLSNDERKKEGTRFMILHITKKTGTN